MTDDFWKWGWRALFGALGAAVYLVLDALENAGILSPPMAALLKCLLVLLAISLFAVMERNYRLLGEGGAPEGSEERKSYDNLRARLAEGGLAKQLYIDWLTKALGKVDGFFGDTRPAGEPPLTLTKPTWTAPAYDKCLLLALLYPIATIFIFWAISNHIGVAETALGFKDQPEGWKRGLAFASVLFLIVALYKLLKAEEIRANWLWRLVVVVAGAVVVVVAGVGAGAVAGVLVVVVVVAGVGAGAVVVAVLAAVAVAVVVAVVVAGAVAVAGAFAFAFAFTFADPGAGAFAGAFAVVVGVAFAVAFAVVFAVGGAVGGAVAGAGAVAVVAAVAFAVAFAGAGADANAGAVVVVVAVTVSHEAMIRRGRQGVFLVLFTPIMIATCLAAPLYLAPHDTWEQSGPLLLFLGLLTLLNAPFDWFCLGLTRFLLRRGLAAGGWQPFFYALLDALLTTGVILVLALAMIVGVQAFDGLAALRGAKPVLPLNDLLAGIAAGAWDPKNWWVYALLLSTFIPSLANLMIGGCALMRGIPALSKFLASQMPVGAAVPAFERNWMALVMTGQTLAGILLGAGVQLAIVWYVFGQLLPAIGFQIFDYAGEFVDFDLPGRVIALFKHS